MSVSIRKDIVKDLIEFKIRHIQETIEEILSNWKEQEIEVFLEKAKKGIILESEMDAIALEQLLFELEKYQVILKGILLD